jgi:hypothetical protein
MVFHPFSCSVFTHIMMKNSAGDLVPALRLLFGVKDAENCILYKRAENLCLDLLDGFRQGRQDLLEVADDAIVGDVEDGGAYNAFTVGAVLRGTGDNPQSASQTAPFKRSLGLCYTLTFSPKLNN